MSDRLAFSAAISVLLMAIHALSGSPGVRTLPLPDAASGMVAAVAAQFGETPGRSVHFGR